MTPLLLNAASLAPGFDIRNCRVRWIGGRIAKCMVDKGVCPFARVPGDLCEHPLVDRITVM